MYPMRLRVIRSTLVVGSVFFLWACGESAAPVPTSTAASEISTSTSSPAAPVSPETTLATAVTEIDSSEIPTTLADAVMPNVVCMNLQDAQDLIQTTGTFFSRSFDATGRGRSQLVDRNWIVVSQEPAAGSPLVEGQAMLGAVKYGEPNDC